MSNRRKCVNFEEPLKRLEEPSAPKGHAFSELKLSTYDERVGTTAVIAIAPLIGKRDPGVVTVQEVVGTDIDALLEADNSARADTV